MRGRAAWHRPGYRPNISRHRPPSGPAFGRPDDRLRRTIQYSGASQRNLKERGILDAPLEPVIALAEGETRWQGMTVPNSNAAYFAGSSSET
ncbi:hypothetical protein SAMN05444169_5836 [Bradyrhizobium erythrophlei]|jgi:hypothetical protein|uniref:Uncharacterized protein n=1 Tax=Bradyrhizobium erythrophlei TaxID=1437360 RepID=A0A1M5QCP3_9BRAD|nr:hypothetical protein SAMN05444169_5836 [Bradyrhizobium erythrophlei]